MSGTLRLVLGDQLSPGLASLEGMSSHDVVLMAEVMDEATYVRHHKKKLIFIFSAMRHFAQALQEKGMTVRYVQLDAAQNLGSIAAEVRRALKETGIRAFHRTRCGECRLERALVDLGRDLSLTGIDITEHDDDRFFCSVDEFAVWAKGRKQLRMEYFYREMRRKTGLLLTRDGAPEGGQWNYDQENRSPIDRHYRAPTRLRFATDDITNTVIEMVASRFAEHFGDHHGFDWAVTRTDALAALDHFIKDALPSFGTYQDAMARDEPFLSHGLISFYLNAGLLVPMEVCKAAERAYHEGSAPLHAVEGFIRQVLGWREYVRGIYWQNMPGYDDLNALNASGALPELYWTGQTRMACMAAVIDQTRRHAYAHHIQRLMVTGNFALLAGIAPRAVNEWYMSVFGDAYEWVELPNTHGMALFADGGIMASKPYAASGQYIHRMSDYCASCAYSVSRKTGDAACPFNYLYWDFMARNRSVLSQNPRISRQYFTYDRMAPEQQRDIAESSAKFLRGIGVTKAEECST